MKESTTIILINVISTVSVIGIPALVYGLILAFGG